MRVTWSRFRSSWGRSYAPGEHVTIVGPTGQGKTTLAVELVEPRRHVLFLATKPEDPIVGELERSGWRVTRELEIRTVNGRIIDRRLVYWPPAGRLGEVRVKQAEAMHRALDYVYRSRNWTVLADETVWLADDLRLEDDITTLLYQGRTLGISFVALAQRPAWVPRACYSQASHLFLFATSDRDDLRRLADIGGSKVEEIRMLLPTLQKYEFLYYGTRTGALLISKVERRKAAK